MTERFKPYVPAEWSSYIEYLDMYRPDPFVNVEVDSVRENRSRVHFEGKKVVSVLGSVFTPLCYSLHRLTFDVFEKNLQLPEAIGTTSQITDVADMGGPVIQDYIGALSKVDREVTSNIRNHARMTDICCPVGEYGHRLAFTFVDSARALAGLVVRDMKEECLNIHQQYRYILRNETFQKYASSTLIEGIATEAGALALLTFEKVGVTEWDNNPLAFVRAILDSDLLTDLSKKLPIGEIAGRFINHERYIKPITPQLIDGKAVPALSPAFEKYLAMVKQREMQSNHSDYGIRQLGCPVGAEVVDGEVMPSGISMVGEALYMFLEHYYNAEQEATV